MQDLRLALRNFCKAPLFSSIAVLLIALAMSLNTALFSVLYAAILKPLPYLNSERLVIIGEVENESGFAVLTPANFADLRDAATSFEAVTAHFLNDLELNDVDPPQRVQALYVLNGFFTFAGVPPLVGRTLQGSDFETAASVDAGLWTVGAVAVLDYKFWNSRFGGSTDVIGSTVRLNNKPVRIVGVMPEGFDAMWREADLYVPWILPPDFWNDRPPHILPTLARLRPGVTTEAATAEVKTIYARLAKEYPETNAVLTARVQPLRAFRFTETTNAVFILLLGALLVLMVGCFNLAGLLATKARARVGEVAVRRALGASSSRIARQFVTESFLIVGGGAILGVAAAHAALRAVSLPMSLPFAPELSLPAMGFSLLLLTLTSLFLGLTPAWLVPRCDLASSLRGVSRGASPTRLPGAFIAVQVAIAVGLVSASGLLLRTLTALQTEELGFDKERVLTFYVTLPDARYPDDATKRQFLRRGLEEIRAIPGVISAATASHVPTTPMYVNLATAIEGRAAFRGTFRAAPVFVSHGFFRTMRVPLQRGRDFDDRDSEESPWVIVVNERMARDFWPGEEAIGRRIRLEYSWALDQPLTVIGCARDVKQESLDREVQPSFYLLNEQLPNDWLYFVIRTDGEPQVVAPAIRSRIASVDPQLPVTDMRTMEERLDRSVIAHRTRAILVTLYAVAALALATLGLTGMVLSQVSQRMHELVIRIALGATRGHITRLVMTESLKQLSLGLMLGLVGAVFADRLISGFLYRVKPTDIPSLLGTMALLTASGLLATFIPAHRASRRQPAMELRQE
jgi:putative ABC transport system permease protein